MSTNILKIILTILLITHGTLSQWNWDFAVTTTKKIVFYDANWFEVKSAAHEFEDLSAIYFDDVEDRIYFSDRSDKNYTIFSLKLPLTKSESIEIEKVVPRESNEHIGGIAYDPLNRNLFYTDAINRKIFLFPVDSDIHTTPKVLFDFPDKDIVPKGVAIDICRRKLYWTNTCYGKATIEMASLSGDNHTTLVDESLHYPHAIVVDQLTDRIYYVVDQEGIYYTVESTKLDGTDRQVIMKGIDSKPNSLTVTADSIYWTDSMHECIWRIPNDNSTNHQPTKVKAFNNSIRGIVSRPSSKWKRAKDCKSVVQKATINSKRIPKSNRVEEIKKHEDRNDVFCLGRGVFNSVSLVCSCNSGYNGGRCERYECENYCVHGTCEIVEDWPQCTCKQGFTGDRCQTYKCNDYCLNGGLCSIVDDSPVCYCEKNIIGDRCENNLTDTCRPFCALIEKENNVDGPLHCVKVCRNLDPNEKLPQAAVICSNTWNISVAIIVVGVLLALALIYLIIQAIRIIYKPARPRIKKTFVVQKKMSQTPLTSRPIATEQCEITIENCCNMNICDTPCFDPKLLEENMSKQSKKEDKQHLIQSSDNDIY